MTLSDLNRSASFPIQVRLDPTTSTYMTVISAATGKDGKGRKIHFDASGLAYVAETSGSLKHVRSPEHDLDPKSAKGVFAP